MAAVPPALAEALADRYQLERELGRGGMATVYLGRDLKHDRLVALKVLHQKIAVALGPERFLLEIQTAARLDHPHLLPVFDSGESAGFLWYTMPYVEGESLRERIRREGQLPLDEATRLVREVADALDCAHQHGVVHRDIKPENILLAGGHARLADFGVASAIQAAGADRLTETGLTVGTPAYMSPEQATGSQVDGRSDQYSLACVLFEMLAGEPPYNGPTAQAILAKRFSEPVPHLGTLRDVPESVEIAVSRALSKSRADRFATLSDFAAALQRNVRKPVVTQRMAALLGGVAALTILALFAFLLRPKTTGAPGIPANERSLAVLPLTNVGGDPKEEYLSDGLTEELIAALARVPGLRVAARSSAFAFKGKPTDVKEVGSRLGVAHVLEGSVRRSGARLRVTAELVKVGDGLTLWSQTYARDMKDLLQVQEELARSISGALQVSLSGGDSARLGSHPTEDLEAYNLYLQGMYFWNKRNESGFRRAKGLFEQAIARDSGYAEAWMGLGAAYTLLGDWAFEEPRRMFALSRKAALKALTLDSTLAGAHAVLGYTKMDQYDLSGGEAELRRARELDPANPLVRHWHAWTLVSLRRIEEAVAEIEQAHQLDPLSLPINRTLGWMLGYAGRYREATTQLQHALALDPAFAASHGTLGLLYLAQGEWSKAIHELEFGGGEQVSGWLGFAYAKAGFPGKAKQLLLQRLAESTRNYVAPVEVARIYLGLGEREQAISWLQRAHNDRSLEPYSYWPDTLYSLVHSDPRFQALWQNKSR
jgi:eukaryotic-like serine/threonine-protein kinase